MAEPQPSPTAQILSVGQLTRYLKYLVENDTLLSALSVRGEISELSRSPAGHTYLSIKDDAGQLACVLFRREAARQPEEVAALRQGLEVVLHGFVTVYEARGSYQLVVERVVPQGEGAARRRFEQLRSKLESEGLFAPERKRSLPQFPRTLALITSPRGQAYHDVLRRLRDHYPFVKVVVAGVSVQGAGAADEMVMALDIVNRLTAADVIVLVRGGGSPEDLAAFNDERLARAIFASRLPVIAGIGHELDVSIADLVADHRAATPSLAAAAAVPDVRALVQRMGDLHDELTRMVHERLRSGRRGWRADNQLLLSSSPAARLRSQRQRGDEAMRAQRRAMATLLRVRRSQLTGQQAQLKALDPLSILQRGYAVLTEEETGRVVASTSAVPIGTRLVARVADGTFAVRKEEL